MSNSGGAPDHNDELRDKMDVISDRIRHASHQAGGSTSNETTGTQEVHTQPPVADRLDNLEVRYNNIHSFMEEIRDSIRSGTFQTAQPGQAQPRGEPLGNPLPAKGPPVGVTPIPDHRTGAAAEFRRPGYGLNLPPPLLTPHVPAHSRTHRRKTAAYQAEEDQYAEYLPRDPQKAPIQPLRRSREHRSTAPGRAHLDTALARQYQQMGQSTGRTCDITPPRCQAPRCPTPRHEKASKR